MNDGITMLRELADTLEQESKLVDEMEKENERLRAVNAELVEALRYVKNSMETDQMLEGIDFGNELYVMNEALFRAEQAKPELAGPSTRQTLRAVLECCRTWSPDACVMGNVRAGQIVAALESVLAQGQAKPETCVWKFTDHIWTSGCGERSIQSVREGKYCPFCGKRVEVRG